MTFRDAILKIIYDNSGGCKMTILLSEILCMIYEDEISDYDRDMLSECTDFPKYLIYEVKNISEIGVLEYLWNGTNPSRIKMFVYMHK